MYGRRNKKGKNSGKHRLEAVIIEGKEVVDRIVTAATDGKEQLEERSGAHKREG